MREEEKKRSSRGSSFKRFFKKRWVYPAIYILSAAIILTAVLWFQNNNNETDSGQTKNEATDIAGKKYNEPAVEVNRSLENFSMPVTNPDSVVIQKQFYDFDGKKEEQESALVFYNNTYHPNTGIDMVMEDGKTFDIVASLSGTVTNVLEDALLGNVIEIEHDNGIVTQYQSVTDIDVKVGDQVKKGQTIAKAGKSLYNEEAGTHVHFEIRKNDIPVNPLDYFNKPLSTLQEANVTEKVDDSGKADQSEGTQNSDSSDDQKDESQKDGDNTDEDKEKTGTDEDKSDDGNSTDTEEDADSADSSNA